MTGNKQRERVICHYLPDRACGTGMPHRLRESRIGHHLSGANPGAALEDSTREFRQTPRFRAQVAGNPAPAEHDFQVPGKAALLASAPGSERDSRDPLAGDVNGHPMRAEAARTAAGRVRLAGFHWRLS